MYIRGHHILNRPGRHTQRPVVSPPDELPEPVPAAEIDAYCDEYMARLSISTILTQTQPDKPPTARTSGTDKAVLGALCFLARLQDCSCIAASEAEITRRASLGNTDTAARALARLESAHYVIRHPSSSCGVANSYTLVMEKLVKTDGLGSAPVRLADVTDLDSVAEGNLEAAAFRAKNIGKTATAMYAYLAAHPDLTMAAIARGTGRHKSTVKANLEKLRVLSMAEEYDGLWRVYTRSIRQDTDLPKVVAVAGRRRAARRLAREEERLTDAQSQQALYAHCWALAHAPESSL